MMTEITEQRDAKADLEKLQRTGYLGTLAEMAKEVMPYWINRAQGLEAQLDRTRSDRDKLHNAYVDALERDKELRDEILKLQREMVADIQSIIDIKRERDDARERGRMLREALQDMLDTAWQEGQCQHGWLSVDRAMLEKARQALEGGGE